LGVQKDILDVGNLHEIKGRERNVLVVGDLQHEKNAVKKTFFGLRFTNAHLMGA
jgi:hypothetical protein